MKSLLSIFLVVLFCANVQAAEKTKIDNALYIGSGLLGTFVGFGTGHMLQDRWDEIGWVFTVGEAAGFGILLASWILPAGSLANALTIAGWVTFSGFRIWDIIDIWGEPVWDNRLALHGFGPEGSALAIQNRELIGHNGLTFSW